MKLNPAYIFIASLASGVYASGNLCSHQYLSHDAEEELESRINKPVVDMKENLDDSRLLEGDHRPTALEKHRMVESENHSYMYGLTLEEAEKYIQEMDALSDEATMTDPEIGIYAQRNEEEPSVKELIQEERMQPPSWSPEDDDSVKPTPPPDHTLLSITFRTDSWPQENSILLKDESHDTTRWELYPKISNHVYTSSVWLPNNCCFSLYLPDRKKDGLWGKGLLTVKYGNKVEYGKKQLSPTSFAIFDSFYGNCKGIEK